MSINCKVSVLNDWWLLKAHRLDMVIATGISWQISLPIFLNLTLNKGFFGHKFYEGYVALRSMTV